MVNRISPYEHALAELRSRIADGEWPVGAKIPTEPALMELLAVSRNTLREAVKTLTSTGILEIRRGEGTFVRARSAIGGLVGREVRSLSEGPEQSVEEIIHVFEVRRALETEAAGLACRRRTDEDLRRLRDALDRRAAAVRDGADITDPDLDFHAAVLTAAHNRFLDDFYSGIAEPLRALMEFVRAQCEPEKSSDAHTELVDALERRDERTALRCARAYLDAMTEDLDQALKEN